MTNPGSSCPTPPPKPAAPAAAPNGSPNAPLRCYNDLLNAAYEEAGRRPGWRHYQSPAAEVKPLLATSIAYTFPPDQVRPLPAGQVRGGGPPHDVC